MAADDDASRRRGPTNAAKDIRLVTAQFLGSADSWIVRGSGQRVEHWLRCRVDQEARPAKTPYPPAMGTVGEHSRSLVVSG